MKKLMPITAAVAAALIVGGCAQPASRAENAASSEEALRMKAQCSEAGAKTRAEWIAKYNREHFSQTPEYAYNASLNTCLYADSYWDTNNLIVKMGGGNMVEVRFILDVYTNKTLIEYTAYDGKPIKGSPSEAEFEAAKRRLMGGPASAQGQVP